MLRFLNNIRIHNKLFLGYSLAVTLAFAACGTFIYSNVGKTLM